ncbi:hypothetical protein [Rhodococcus sp. SJ-3]|uniref:hypothetical protein n=1 Tax=Rhodococcus sp. SJ-3 TaxID=3454628 RepID=UPI003F7908FD
MPVETSLAPSSATQGFTPRAHALAEAKALAHDLAEQGIPVCDIGAILGVTFQRASQLVNS